MDDSVVALMEDQVRLPLQSQVFVVLNYYCCCSAGRNL